MVQAMDFVFFLDGKISHRLHDVLCRKNNSVLKIVGDGLLKTLIRALPYGTVWVDESSPFVVLWSGEPSKLKLSNA